MLCRFTELPLANQLHARTRAGIVMPTQNSVHIEHFIFTDIRLVAVREGTTWSDYVAAGRVWWVASGEGSITL